MKYTHKQVKDILQAKKGPGRGLVEDSEIVTDLDLNPYDIIEQLLEECESWKNRADTEYLRANELEKALGRAKFWRYFNLKSIIKIIKDFIGRLFG